MSEIRVKGEYAIKKNKSFFNDEPQEYYGFVIVNPEVIPTDSLYKREWPCWIWISEELIKRFNLNFEIDKVYQFIMTLGEKGAAKFTTKNNNLMVLKSLTYFENTIKKIGWWGNENYFYERKRDYKNNNDTSNSSQDGNENSLGKFFLFNLSIISLAFSFYLIIKWLIKKYK